MKNFFLILLLSFAIGYVSLSQEIIWFQIIGYSTGGEPSSFSLVLGLFLLGIAFGAYCVPKFFSKYNHVDIIASCLSISSIVFCLSIPFTGSLMAFRGKLGGNALEFFVFFTPFLTGCIFPLLCHEFSKIGPSHTSVGSKISWVYFSNIMGSTLGPICTSFILMEFFPLKTIVFFLSLLSSLLIFLVYLTNRKIKIKYTFIPSFFVIMIAFFFEDVLYKDIWEKIHFKSKYKNSYQYFSKSRSGIAAVDHKDIIYGGGLYDSVFNTEIAPDKNGINRAYAIPTLHKNPKKILVIGLSSGSWVRVLAKHRDIEDIQVVEINKGYLELIKKYPDHAEILNMKKVKIHFDDGRRWIKRHPDEKFDFILMNTTFYWRAYTSNLISKEFMTMCKNSLKEDGVLYFNTTGYEGSFKTAAHVFKHVIQFSNFIAVSQQSFTMTEDEKERALMGFVDDNGSPYFKSANRKRAFSSLKSETFLDLGDKYRNTSTLRITTDDNMAPEYVHSDFDDKRRWKKIISRIFDKSPSKKLNIL